MQSMCKLNVAMVDDDDLFRKSLSRWIAGREGLRCSGHYATAEEALAMIPESDCDVVLMDINLPSMSGIDCVRKLKAVNPDCQIIMLTVHEDTDLIFKALQAGANGYLLKRSSPDKILEAIVDVSRGGAPMSSYIARKVVQSFQDKEPLAGEHANLTKREEEILGYLVKGFVNKEIADALSISVETIRVHLKSIYEKLHVRSRTEAALKCLRK
jgi:DNA-binding NarL/FixJ family response regulator